MNRSDWTRCSERGIDPVAMGGCFFFSAVSVFLLVLVLVAVSGSAAAEAFDRKQLLEKRTKVMDWCKRHGALIKGMTKAEVLDVYGRPDRKFNYNIETGRLEQWIYYYPRRRSIFPLNDSPFQARYRYLYFRNDVLINFER